MYVLNSLWSLNRADFLLWHSWSNSGLFEKSLVFSKLSSIDGSLEGLTGVDSGRSIRLKFSSGEFL